MISPEAQAMRKQFIDNNMGDYLANTPLKVSREGWEEESKNLPLPEGISYEEVFLAGVRCESVKAEGVAGGQLVLYLHGGGYTSGSPATHRALASYLSRATEREVLVVDYRLAPEHPFPAGLNDAFDVYTALLEKGYKGEDIIIGGDSAGGGMTMALSYKIRDSRVVLPKALFLLSPWADLTASGESHKTKVEIDPFITMKGLVNSSDAYCSEAQLKEPLVSPVFGTMESLPPLYIQVGEEEILLSDAFMLRDRASEAGVEVTFEEWKGLWHVWHLAVGVVPEADRAVALLGDFVKKHFN